MQFRDRMSFWLDRNYFPSSVVLWLAVLVLLSLLGAVINTAHAATATATWTLPTQNTDNSAIPATGPGAIVSTQLKWGTCTGTAAAPVFGVEAGNASVPAPALTHVVTGLGPGTVCFAAAVTNTYGVQSAFTGAVRKVIAPPTPRPPVLVTVATTAYELRRLSTGELKFVAVGTVRLRTQCGPRLVGRYAAVTGAKLTKPTHGGIIAAKCAVG